MVYAMVEALKQNRRKRSLWGDMRNEKARNLDPVILLCD